MNETIEAVRMLQQYGLARARAVSDFLSTPSGLKAERPFWGRVAFLLHDVGWGLLSDLSSPENGHLVAEQDSHKKSAIAKQSK